MEHLLVTAPEAPTTALGAGSGFVVQLDAFSGPLDLSEVNGPDIKAENDFGKTTVKTLTRSVTADGRKLKPGDWATVKIERADAHDLWGRLVS